jgi:hypothetical protein
MTNSNNYVRTPAEWQRDLVPIRLWETCYPLVQDAAQSILDDLPKGTDISTVQLLDMLCPMTNVPAMHVKAIQNTRARMYRALTANPPNGMPMAGYCTQGPATKNRYGKMAHHWAWHAFTLS